MPAQENSAARSPLLLAALTKGAHRMNRWRLAIAVALVCAPSAPAGVSFDRDVQPLLSRCVQCHGPGKAKAGLRLDRRPAHWAYRPLARTEPPRAAGGWARTPIDRFILAKLAERGLMPSPPADKRTLLRRVYFDLVGLPPAPEEIDAFLADNSPDAYEKVVEKLLASPAYGERWGRHWLDLVRYAETRGHEFDVDIPDAWRYRDYVIRAFNADLPYDRFVTEHVAGDLLPEP